MFHQSSLSVGILEWRRSCEAEERRKKSLDRITKVGRKWGDYLSFWCKNWLIDWVGECIDGSRVENHIE